MSIDSKLKISQFSYSAEGLLSIKNMENGTNWPFVYLIHDNKKLYIGETQNIYYRTKQHLTTKDVGVSRNSCINTICDSSFNKSAILDIENSLIRLFESENKYSLLNIKQGQSALHNYYQKDYYHNQLTEKIWNELIKLKLVEKPLYLLKNLDIFKYSPYVLLTNEQLEISTNILSALNESLSKNQTGTFIVHGGAGTGKTVLAIYLLSILKECLLNNADSQDSDDYDSDLTDFNLKRKTTTEIFNEKGIKNIGFVVPMTSLRNTLKKVFKKIKFKNISVLGPNDVIKKDYDILFVDETHRLFHRKNLTGYKSYDNVSRKLGLEPKESNQLQWIMLRSKFCVLFYDENQTVKKSDITKTEYKAALKMHDLLKAGTLTTQLRCEGGDDYTFYIDQIMNCESLNPLALKGYDAKFFNKIDDMVSAIRKKNDEIGLSLLVAGYGFEWKSHKLSYERAVAENKYDIIIDDTKLIWNTTPHCWIMSPHAKDEVGCIHTTQGYDLNYAGVIFGPEIDYDPAHNKMIINKDKFFDKKVKADTNNEELKRFIINSYAVLLKRGIKGTYIYCVNDNLKKYLSQYFEII